MAGRKTFVAAALMSAISATSALADDPDAFQAMYPNRDVLNGGALTPAGRMGLEQSRGAVRGASPSFRAQHYHSRDPATDTFLGYDGRRHPSR
jgi:hypothetical protein